ncbi:YcxB family protein [Promicromonospora sp. NPDC090134]|uniref:YcxB family protein n=1 Tax=Promicromonospora sp. NPDC090134 TaxID=3364408 RepID=UPI003801486A
MTTQNHPERATGTGTGTEYDFVPVRADYVAVLRSLPQLAAARVLAWVMLALGVLLALLRFVVVDAEGNLAGDPRALELFLVAGIPAALFFGYPWLGGPAAWRLPANREPVRAVLDADGFAHEGPSGSQTFAWGVASRAWETAEAYYVYVPNGLASLVWWLPKRAVPLAEQAAVRERIQQRVRRYRIR